MKNTLALTLLLQVCLSALAQNETLFVDQRDNKEYKVITINNQTWFAENLAYETKRGSWVYKKEPSYSKIYGRLYDWKTACSACPSGWRLPSLEDYMTLMKNINASDSLELFNALVEGGKSGFEAKFAGWYAGRQYGQLNEHTDFWTSSVYKPFPGATEAPTRFSIFRRDKLIYSGQDFSSYGFSVRCIKG